LRSSQSRICLARGNEVMARFLLISGVQNRLRCLAKEHSLNTRVVLIAFALAGYGLFGTLANEWARPVAIQDATHGVEIEVPSSLPRSIATLPRSIATLPTATAPEEPAPPRAGYAAASLPALEPLRTVTSLPTVTPALEPKEMKSTGCDPAYPDKRTCIPPGPPFDQGCAITSERRFEVLPPDPQGLDHDGDGIGCEPIRAST
jgi:hypothetical protein